MKIKPRWPAEVPILSPGDFKGATLLGWLGFVFTGEATFESRFDNIIRCPRSAAFVRARRMMERAIVNLAGRHFTCIEELDGCCRVPSQVNDTRALAKVWNVTMAKLGYTDGNPCAKDAAK